MTLEIKKYGTPVLRQKGARVEKITPELKQLVADMLETMRSAKGVGLAAQQVGVVAQVAVIDVRAVTDRPSSMEVEGKKVNPEDYMPLVLINPEITPTGEKVQGPEGCLSFPEIFGDVIRPATIDVRTLNQEGIEFRFSCGGLLARAIQHEADHLNGILFIDRMVLTDKEEIKPQLDELQAKTKKKLKMG